MALGGAAAALLDPVSGTRRRHMLRDRVRTRRTSASSTGS
jgi:hypothetical protein